ncbi:MAG: hypothetical protein M1817_004741 [Caeruleum heppii]|nr:MAG: hypothetical protein M1817_004741 [Caeruleum heppii]
MVDEESLRLNVNVTPQFIGALTEMVWAQIGGDRECMPDAPPLAQMMCYFSLAVMKGWRVF